MSGSLEARDLWVFMLADRDFSSTTRVQKKEAVMLLKQIMNGEVIYL